MNWNASSELILTKHISPASDFHVQSVAFRVFAVSNLSGLAVASAIGAKAYNGVG